MSSIFQKFRYLIPKERTASGHQQIHEGGRDWENMYRDRWSFDKRVRSTHGVNCTGSCSWNVYVKDGLVAWENGSILNVMEIHFMYRHGIYFFARRRGYAHR